MAKKKEEPPKTVYKVARLFHEGEDGMTFSPFEDPVVDQKAIPITDAQQAWALADERARKSGVPHGVFALVDVRRPETYVHGQLTKDAHDPSSPVHLFRLRPRVRLSNE